MNPDIESHRLSNMSQEQTEPRPELILIAAGPFLMGSDSGQDNERPIHRVWLDAFWLAKFPVTNQEYRVFVKAAGAAAPPFWNAPAFCHPLKPVVGVNWFEAQAYCEWLCRATGKPFRLPTEAEWEKGARGGRAKQDYPWGHRAPSELLLPGCDGDNDGPLPVGQGDINDFGLCDLSGGVHEWCSDWYAPNYYAAAPETSPQGAWSGKRRSSRGGSWRHRVKFSRCAARSSLDPSFHYADYGFRLAMDGRGENIPETCRGTLQE